MDPSKISLISLIVSCVALFLTIPFAIFGNILTPKVRDWWAANTGRQRLEKRIRTLQEKLRIAEESWCFTDAEWEIYEDSYWGRYILLFGGAALSFLVICTAFLASFLLRFFWYYSSTAVISSSQARIG